jgi:hypothetical protein
MMATLLDTLNKIQSDPELTKKFLIDPDSALREQGIDTSSMKVTKTTDPRSGWVRADATVDRSVAADLTAGRADAIGRLPTGQLRATVCGSIGYIVCGSVGD